MSSTENQYLASRALTSIEKYGFDPIKDIYHAIDNPDGFLLLGLAENTLMHDELIEYINKNVSLTTHSLTYGDGAWGSDALRKALSAFLNRHLKPFKTIEEDHVLVTAGVTNACEMLGFTLANSGDGILLGRPFYSNFLMDWGARAGVKTVQVDFGTVDPLSEEAVRCYEDALVESEKEGVKVRALMLCHPHNPLGRCYPVPTLKALLRLCQKYSIHFISDEIYALTVWDNPLAPDAEAFTSVLSLDLNGIIDLALVHVLWGMSKDFGANGLRLGVIVSQHNAIFRKALRAIGPFNYPSAAGDCIAATVLADKEFTDWYIAENKKRVGEAYVYATGLLEQYGIPYTEGMNAAFFLWMDMRKVKRTGPNGQVKEYDHDGFLKRLGQEKVWIRDGQDFGGPAKGWFRMVFTYDRDTIREGIERVARALDVFK